jgi:hypothetical protein
MPCTQKSPIKPSKARDEFFRLESGLIRTKETTDLGADDTSQHTTRFIRGGSAVVGAN